MTTNPGANRKFSLFQRLEIKRGMKQEKPNSSGEGDRWRE
ncbi:MAG: hypothetical protein ACI9PC_000009 [Porticoccaceae bacterium]|jgi:hypothetical protein